MSSSQQVVTTIEEQGPIYRFKVKPKNDSTFREFTLSNDNKELTINIQKDDVVYINAVKKRCKWGGVTIYLMKNGKTLRKMSDLTWDFITVKNQMDEIDQISAKLSPPVSMYTELLSLLLPKKSTKKPKRLTPKVGKKRRMS